MTPLPAPENALVKPACPVRPFFGVEPVLLDDKVPSFILSFRTIFLCDSIGVAENLTIKM